MKRSHGFLASMVVIHALLPIATSPGRAAAAASLEDVVQAWRTRQKSVESIDFSWKGTQFIAKGHSHDLIPADSAPVPDQDISFDTAMRFAVHQDGRVRLEVTGRSWDVARKKFLTTRCIDVFNGQARELLFTYGQEKTPNGHISRKSASHVARDARVLPLRLVYRPLDETMGVFDARTLKLTGDREMIDGVECVVLTCPDGTVYVDPQRDFLPVRYAMARRGNVHRIVSIGFVRHPEYGWTPKAWIIAQLNQDGDVVRSESMVVNARAINQPVDDTVFQVEYPVGTYVNNYITGERYIVEKNGKKRPVKRGELDPANRKAFYGSSGRSALLAAY